MKISSSGRRWFLISMFTVASLTSPAVRQSCFADEESEDAAPEFSEYLREDRNNFIYIADTAPVVQRFLKSKGGQRVVELFAQGNRRMTAKSLLRDFENEVEQFLPDQICLAMSNKSMAGVSEFINTGMHIGLCAGAVQAGESDALDELQKGLIESLKKVELQEIDIWIRFRNEVVPTMLESQLRATLSQMTEGTRVDVELELNGLSATMKPRDFVPASVVSGGLFALGITDDLSDAELREAGEVIADKSLSIRVTRYGSALLIQLGGSDNSKPENTLKTDAGQLWSDDDTMLMYSRYDLTEMSRSLKEANNLWLKYEKTPIGDACRELDKEDILGELKDLIDVFEMDVSGELRATLNDQLIITGRESGHKQIPSLAESGIAKFTPASSSSCLISTEYSLSDLIRGTFSSFEDSFKDQSDDDVTESPIQPLRDFYYSEMKEFRRLVREELPSVVVSPMAMIARSDMATTTITVNFDFEGDPNSITFVDLPVPTLAFVGQVGSDQDPTTFANAAKDAFLKALKVSDRIEMATEFEIEGVEVPALMPTTAWQKDVLPYGIEVLAEGSPTLHTVILPDRWVIVSTSTELTKEILKASKDPSLRKTFTEQELAGTNLFTGGADAINNSILLPLRVLRMIGVDEVEMSGQGDFGEGFVIGFKGAVGEDNLGRIIFGMESMLKEMNDFRFETQHSEGIRNMKITVNFAE